MVQGNDVVNVLTFFVSAAPFDIMSWVVPNLDSVEDSALICDLLFYHDHDRMNGRDA